MKKLFRHIPRSLRWGVFFGIGIFIVGVSVAVHITIPQKVTGDPLEATEFNQISQVLSEVYNSDGGNVGIGTPPVSGVKLNVDGIIRVRPRSAAPTCGNGNPYKGQIYFDGNDKHFYVCRGTGSAYWVQLDN